MQLRYFLGETALKGTTEMMWCFLIEQMTGSWQNLKNNSDKRMLLVRPKKGMQQSYTCENL